MLIFFYCSPSLHHLSFQDCIFISGDRLDYIRKIWQAIMLDCSSSLPGYMSSNSALRTSDMHLISPFLLLIFVPRKLLKGCYCTNWLFNAEKVLKSFLSHLKYFISKHPSDSELKYSYFHIAIRKQNHFHCLQLQIKPPVPVGWLFS